MYGSDYREQRHIVNRACSVVKGLRPALTLVRRAGERLERYIFGYWGIKRFTLLGAKRFMTTLLNKCGVSVTSAWTAVAT